MLTQGPTPDSKCNLNISSFLTLPHFSDCLICTRNSMFIVLLLQMMGGWVRWGVVDLSQGWEEGTGGGYYLAVSALFFFFNLCFCPLFSHVLCLFFK